MIQSPANFVLTHLGPYNHWGGGPVNGRLNQQCWPQRLVQEQDSPLPKCGHPITNRHPKNPGMSNWKRIAWMSQEVSKRYVTWLITLIYPIYN